MGANLGQARKVHKRQVENMRRVNLKIDRLTIDAFVAASYPRGLVLDFSLDIGKIREPSARDMMELSPLRASSGSRRSVRIVERVRRFFILLNVDKLQDQRSPGADAASSGQKITADDIF